MYGVQLLLYTVQDVACGVKLYTVQMAYPGKTDRDRILAVALQHVEEAGIEKLAVRCVAGTLGLAPNAIYSYFKNLSALGEAVAEEARRQAVEFMMKAAGKKGPLEAIRAIAEAHLRFAQERPRLYELFMRTSGKICPQCVRSADFFLEQTSRLYSKERAEEASFMLQAILHGLAALNQAGAFTPKDLSKKLRFSLQTWVAAADLAQQ